MKSSRFFSKILKTFSPLRFLSLSTLLVVSSFREVEQKNPSPTDIKLQLRLERIKAFDA
ncbi:MAG: hypothetical protein QXT57_01225 [Thermosphaera sp.]